MSQQMGNILYKCKCNVNTMHNDMLIHRLKLYIYNFNMHDKCVVYIYVAYIYTLHLHSYEITFVIIKRRGKISISDKIKKMKETP